MENDHLCSTFTNTGYNKIQRYDRPQIIELYYMGVHFFPPSITTLDPSICLYTH